MEAFFSVLGPRRLPGGALLRDAVCRRLLLMSSPPAGGRKNVNDSRSPLGNLPTVFLPQADCILIKKRKAKKKKKRITLALSLSPF